METLFDILRDNRNSYVRININNGKSIPFDIRYDESDNTFKYWNKGYQQKVILQGGLFNISAEHCSVINDKVFSVGDRVVFDRAKLRQTVSYTEDGEPEYKFINSTETEKNPIGKITDAKIADDDGCIYYTVYIPSFGTNITIGSTMLAKLCSKIVD